MPGEPAVIIRAREDLRSAATELEALRRHLSGVRASVPPTEQETGPHDISGPHDVETAIRLALEEVVEELDHQRERLRAAADYQPEAGR